jgi:hypothetical protein
MPSSRASIRASAASSVAESATSRSSAARATNVEVIAAMMMVRKAIPLEHDKGGDDTPGGVLRRHVAVTHGGHRLQRPPHANPDVRVLVVVEHPHQDAADDDYHRSRCDDNAGSGPHGGGFAQEARHAALDEVGTSYARHTRAPSASVASALARRGRSSLRRPRQVFSTTVQAL